MTIKRLSTDLTRKVNENKLQYKDVTADKISASEIRRLTVLMLEDNGYIKSQYIKEVQEKAEAKRIEDKLKKDIYDKEINDGKGK